MNNLCINGRLTKDPEVKNLENDNSLCTFFIAHDDYRGGKKTTGFYRCAAFGKIARSISDMAQTGTELFIEGRLDQYRYEDKNGKMNYNTGILVSKFDFGRAPKSASEQKAA